MSFKRLSDTQFEIREGGGCLSLFGLPFFAAGIFMLLIAAGLIPMQNASDLKSWPRLMVTGMGAIFTTVGGGLVFGRTRILIDKAQAGVRRNQKGSPSNTGTVFAHSARVCPTTKLNTSTA